MDTRNDNTFPKKERLETILQVREETYTAKKGDYDNHGSGACPGRG
jgi:hypothetical protein